MTEIRHLCVRREQELGSPPQPVRWCQNMRKGLLECNELAPLSLEGQNFLFSTLLLYAATCRNPKQEYFDHSLGLHRKFTLTDGFSSGSSVFFLSTRSKPTILKFSLINWAKKNNAEINH